MPDMDIAKAVEDAVLDSMVEKEGADVVDETALAETLTKALTEALDAVEKSVPDLSQLSADEFAFYKGLDADGGSSFLAKSADERAKDIAKAKDGDEVLKIGDHEIKKSEAGESMFAIMKAQQAQIEAANNVAKAEMEKRLDAEFAKRAEAELPNLPGEPLAKGKALRAIEKMDEETADTIKTMLKSASAANGKLMKETGTSAGGAGGGTAFSKLDSMAKQFQKEDSKLDYYAAYAKAEELNPELRDAAINGE